MKDVPIADPEIENLGPAMLALTPMQRRFVIGWIGTRGQNASRVARAAGYSNTKEGARSRAREVLHNPKVMKALHEEAGRRLDGMAAIAVATLEMNMADTNPKVRQVAVDSVLDRTGYARRTEQAVQIQDKRPPRNYEQLLSAVIQKLQQHNLTALAPPIEAEFEEVAVEDAPTTV